MNRKIRLGIDMDGVIVDFMTTFLEAANNILELNLKYKDITSPKTSEIICKYLSKGAQKFLNPTRKLYDIVCASGFYSLLKPYPKAIEAVKELSKLYEIIIITKPINWETSPYEKSLWLKEYLNNIEYNLIMVSNTEQKSYIDVDYIIDDDPRVIEKVKTAWPIIIKHPWNKDFIEEYEHSLLAADSLYDCCNLLETTKNKNYSF